MYAALALLPLVLAASTLHADSLASAPPAVLPASLSPAEQIEFFEKKVRPLLAENCFACHGANSKPLMGNLRLDTRVGLRKGGDRGAAITPGKPLDSLLLQAVRYENKDVQMPPKSKLSAEQIAVLTQWVTMGAPFPGTKAPLGNASAQNQKTCVSFRRSAFLRYEDAAAALGLAAGPPANRAARQEQSVGSQSHRRFHSGASGKSQPETRATGR